MTRVMNLIQFFSPWNLGTRAHLRYLGIIRDSPWTPSLSKMWPVRSIDVWGETGLRYY